MEVQQKKEKPKILIVDDSESILFLLESILSVYFDVVLADRAKKALEIVDKNIDTIIMDLMMPEMSGIDFLKAFRKNTELQYIPVIVLTAKHNTEADIATLFELGANDYVNKPFLSAELVARVKTHSKVKLLTEELMEANERLKYSATHDELTSVFNRNAILDFLENDILRIKRSKKKLVLLMFDIDHFKDINDIHGHQAGDMVLTEVIKLIKDTVREIDIIGRYGGDEFLIILQETNINKASEISSRVLQKINTNDFMFENKILKVTLSIGLSEYSSNETMDRLIERVDNALYDAKKAGRNCIKTR
jgi:diguanylate cyclase (GGDEF)-like protein